jgi:hypothetical protein
MRRGLEDADTSLTVRSHELDETTPVESLEWCSQAQTLPQTLVHEYRIARLEQRQMILEQGLPATLSSIMVENQPICATIASLGIPGYELRKVIPVTIRPDGNEFTATFFDANISTGGDTEQEAVANLQSLIADFYDDLVATPDEKLGPSLRRQKLVLVEFVCQT